MKRYIASSLLDENEEFVPELTSDDVANITDTIYQKIFDKYGRKYRNLQVTIVDSNLYDNTVQAIFDVNKIASESIFEFTPYDSYFDEVDYQTHLNRTIVKFVDNMLN